MERLIELLIKQFRLTETDAIVAVLFAVAGFSLDVFYFPAGVPSTLAAFLTGTTALMISRFLKTRRFLVERSLRNVDRLVARQQMSPAQGEYYKQKLIEQWMDSTHAIPPEEGMKQLPPKSKS